jgi:hypothetical protein
MVLGLGKQRDAGRESERRAERRKGDGPNKAVALDVPRLVEASRQSGDLVGR